MRVSEHSVHVDHRHVQIDVDRPTGANEGCDLDFLRGRSSIVTETVTYFEGAGGTLTM